MKALAYLSWLLKALLFAALFAFALKNSDPVTLRFFFGTYWEMPLILALLLFLFAGVALGILACLSRWFRQRREIVRLRRELRARDAAEPAPPRAAAG
jgi:lipopolysaccharide assembly protein A